MVWRSITWRIRHGIGCDTEEGQPINNFMLLPRTRRMVVKAGPSGQTLTIGEKPAE
jgi:hypothetical protein